ncbi:hypothetical protein L227DRAFT_329843 [Lentinus tigrinus ALCF2SS1-6]|uniref:Uncharacterized protein n=1 Tax=Lentinus tigrinus ALCF2SS1-6 TaxID=1328759 RepID=A0A5C2SL17_9APHY|nr:hypothetical protein L227DRAFT_329843 [Lentinus tigrinus ALCF2SS1-6]
MFSGKRSSSEQSEAIHSDSVSSIAQLRLACTLGLQGNGRPTYEVATHSMIARNIVRCSPMLHWLVAVGEKQTTLSGRTDDNMINMGLDRSELLCRARGRQITVTKIPLRNHTYRSHVTSRACAPPPPPPGPPARGFPAVPLPTNLRAYILGRTQLYPADLCSPLSREVRRCSSSHAQGAYLMILHRRLLRQCLRNKLPSQASPPPQPRILHFDREFDEISMRVTPHAHDGKLDLGDVSSPS